MKCTVTVSRRYSSDLVHGGMKIPCQLAFSGKDSKIKKLHQLLPTESFVAASHTPISAQQSEKD